jgi:hypothetical protein
VHLLRRRGGNVKSHSYSKRFQESFFELRKERVIAARKCMHFKAREGMHFEEKFQH